MRAWIEPLGWMLVHSVWLISLIVAVAAVVLSLLRRQSANARYLVGGVALVLSVSVLPSVFVWVMAQPRETKQPVVAIDTTAAVNATDSIEWDGAGQHFRVDADPDFTPQPVASHLQSTTDDGSQTSHTEVTTRDESTTRSAVDEPTAWQRIEARLRPHLAWLVSGWLAGVCLLSLRPLIGWHATWRLRRVGLSEVPDYVLVTLHRLVERLGLRRATKVFQSSLVRIPCVVGAFKPVILLPASVLVGLSPEQLEALLAHELAHIRRHDFAVNVVQTLAETLLFYHPAIWWLSRRIRQEREHCCDDLAISVCGDVAGYARMLVSVEGLRARVPQTSVAASGGSLVERIRRLLPSPEQTRSPWITGVVVLATLVVLVGSWQLTVGQVSNLPEKDSDDIGRASLPVESATTEKETGKSARPTNKDWPQWGRTPHRNNVAEGRLPLDWNLEKGTNIVWQAKLGSETYSSPIVSGGKVFIGTNNFSALNPAHPKEQDLSCLVCFDEATGKLLWQYASEKLPAGRSFDWPLIGLCSTAYVDGDRVWVVTNRCEVVCLDANGFRDGENDGPFRDETAQTEIDADVIWKFDMFGELGVRPLHQAASSITMVDGVLLLNTSNGPDDSYKKVAAPHAPNFLALDANSGRVIWKDNSAGESIVVGGSSCVCSGASPAVATLGGVTQAIFTGKEGWVYGYDFNDLKLGKTTLLWKFDCNPKTGHYSLGSKSRRHPLVASPIVAEGRVYVATGRNPEHGEGEADLWCIDPTKRGDLSTELVFNKSFENGEQPIPHKPLRACEIDKGDFVRPNPNSGAIWHYAKADRNGDGKIEFDETFHCTMGSPVIHDGLLFIADFSGLMHCLDAKTGEVQWTHDLLSAVWGTCVVADGHVLIGDEDGDLEILKVSRTKQSVFGDTPPNFSQSVYATPALVNGTLFVGSRNTLVAIRDPKQILTTTSWTSFRHDLAQTGVASSPLPGKLEPLWETKLGNQVIGTAAIVGDHVYVPCLSGELFSLDRKSGRKQWAYQSVSDVKPNSFRPGFQASPTVSADAIYLGDEDGVFHAIDRTTGKVRWTFKTDGEIFSSAAVVNGKVLFGSYDSHLYCLNESDGTLAWKFATQGKVHCAPAVIDGLVLIAGCDEHLRVIDIATGAEKKDIPLGSYLIASPAIVGNLAFVGTYGSEVLAVNRTSGDIAWRYSPGKGDFPFHSSAAVTDKLVVLGGHDKFVHGIDRTTGQGLWKFATRGKVESSPVVVGQRVFIGSDDGNLYELDVTTGELRATYLLGKPISASPAIGEGVLVIGSKSNDGRVVCYSGPALGAGLPNPSDKADETKISATKPKPAVKTITGQVVDDHDRPVAGARLWWVVTQTIPDGVIVNGVSDAQGQFSMSAPEIVPPRLSAANETLWVLRVGKQLATVPVKSVSDVDGKVPELIVRLEPETETSLKVVSPNGKPIAGVEVESSHFRTHAGYDIIPAPARKIMSATTDAEGRVELPNMPRQGIHTIRTTSEQFGIQNFRPDGNPNPPTERILELRPTGRIEGQLKADNPDSVRGVSLSFITDAPVRPGVWRSEGFAQVTSDDQGRFVVPAIAAGQLSINVRTERNAPALPRLPKSATINEGEATNLEIAFETPVLVRGTIRTEDTDKPIPGASVSIRYGAGLQQTQAVSDAEGRYEARVLSGPVYSGGVSIPTEFKNYIQTGEPWEEKVDVRADAAPFDLPPIKLTPTIPLKGKLIDQDDHLVVKVTVFGIKGNRRYGFATTNARGEFSTQVPKTVTLDSYRVWLNDGEGPPVTPTIEQREPLILRVKLPALGAGLPTPPTKPTAGLPNDARPKSSSSTTANKETSGPTERRGQETRAERDSQSRLIVEWSAVVDDDIVQSIGQLKPVGGKSQLPMNGLMTRCLADELRSVIRQHLGKSQKVVPGTYAHFVLSSPAGFRTKRKAWDRGFDVFGGHRDQPLGELHVFGERSFVEEENVARLDLDIKYKLTGGLGDSELGIRLSESLNPGDAVAVIVGPRSNPSAKRVVVNVYESLVVPARDVEWMRQLSRCDDWIRLGPTGMKQRIERAINWRSRATQDVRSIDPKWTRDLPNGGHVQLVALSRPAQAPLVWWTPDGRPISGLDPKSHLPLWTPELWVLVRVWEEGARRDYLNVTTAGEWKNGVQELPIDETTAGSQLVIVPAALLKREGRSLIKIGTGFGPWTAETRLDATKGATATLGKLTVKTEDVYEADVISGVNLSASRTLNRFHWTPLDDVDVTILAVRQKGRLTPEANPLVVVNEAPKHSTEFEHAVTKEAIEHFIVKTRPRSWAEFTGFATEPAEPLNPPLEFDNVAGSSNSKQ